MSATGGKRTLPQCEVGLRSARRHVLHLRRAASLSETRRSPPEFRTSVSVPSLRDAASTEWAVFGGRGPPSFL